MAHPPILGRVAQKFVEKCEEVHTWEKVYPGSQIERRLTGGLSAEQRRRLDALTQRRAESGQSWLVWLRQMAEATKPAAMLGLIERVNHIWAIGIDPACGHRVHQARLAQLAREAGRTTRSISPAANASAATRP
jgi:hypothetical protein